MTQPPYTPVGPPRVITSDVTPPLHPPTRVPHTRLPTPTAHFVSGSAYVDSQYGPEFSFQYPQAWFLQSNEEMVNPPPSPTYSPNGMFMPGPWFPEYPKVQLRNFRSGAYEPSILSPHGLDIQIEYAPELCHGETLTTVDHIRTDIDPLTPLQPQAPVGGLPAWRRHFRWNSYYYGVESIEVLVPHNGWLFRFIASPADSDQIHVFENVLESFQIH